MQPKKYAKKIKLAPVKFEDAIKALLEVKPLDNSKKEKQTEPKTS
jgi:hypothetical protein